MDIQLPFDIYACILHYCSRRDLLALRLTNKSLSDASDPFLYRHIQFDFYAKTIAEAEKEFFRIRGLYEQLRHDKEKAGFVRRLEVREMKCVHHIHLLQFSMSSLRPIRVRISQSPHSLTSMRYPKLYTLQTHSLNRRYPRGSQRLKTAGA